VNNIEPFWNNHELPKLTASGKKSARGGNLGSPGMSLRLPVLPFSLEGKKFRAEFGDICYWQNLQF
jgi:hypothetical protein